MSVIDRPITDEAIAQAGIDRLDRVDARRARIAGALSAEVAAGYADATIAELELAAELAAELACDPLFELIGDDMTCAITDRIVP